MGKGKRRRARPPRDATHNYRPGTERETNMRVALADLSMVTTRNPQKWRREATSKELLIMISNCGFQET
jgi:hypothetical protein